MMVLWVWVHIKMEFFYLNSSIYIGTWSRGTIPPSSPVIYRTSVLESLDY